VQQLKITQKSCFFILKTKSVKTYGQFHRPLNHSAFSTQFPNVGTGKSPRQTCCSEMNFGAKSSIDIHVQQWLRVDHTPEAGK